MQQGHDRVVAVLLENDTKGKIRLPALHIAAKKDDVKAAKLLMEVVIIYLSYFHKIIHLLFKFRVTIIRTLHQNPALLPFTLRLITVTSKLQNF